MPDFNVLPNVMKHVEDRNILLSVVLNALSFLVCLPKIRTHTGYLWRTENLPLRINVWFSLETQRLQCHDECRRICLSFGNTCCGGSLGYVAVAAPIPAVCFILQNVPYTEDLIVSGVISSAFLYALMRKAVPEGIRLRAVAFAIVNVRDRKKTVPSSFHRFAWLLFLFCSSPKPPSYKLVYFFVRY